MFGEIDKCVNSLKSIIPVIPWTCTKTRGYYGYNEVPENEEEEQLAFRTTVRRGRQLRSQIALTKNTNKENVSAIFADIYASSGMRIVLSRTDSLGFIFSQ